MLSPINIISLHQGKGLADDGGRTDAEPQPDVSPRRGLSAAAAISALTLAAYAFLTRRLVRRPVLSVRGRGRLDTGQDARTS